MSSALESGERKERVRLSSLAQSRAKMELAHKYEDEYRALYLKHRKKLFKQNGLNVADPRFSK